MADEIARRLRGESPPPFSDEIQRRITATYCAIL